MEWLFRASSGSSLGSQAVLSMLVFKLLCFDTHQNPILIIILYFDIHQNPILVIILYFDIHQSPVLITKAPILAMTLLYFDTYTKTLF